MNNSDTHGFALGDLVIFKSNKLIDAYLSNYPNNLGYVSDFRIKDGGCLVVVTPQKKDLPIRLWHPSNLEKVEW
jgi:hypothetical protein